MRKAIIEVFDKQLKEIAFEDSVEHWMNPSNKFTEYSEESTNLRPNTFNQAYTMLLGMVEGEIYQNLKYAVRLKGVQHKWKWEK